MRWSRGSLTGLDTRLAMRTFMTFALCAVVPIALSAFISQRVVGEELRRSAERNLASASKSYGLLLYDRLRQSESLLSTLGRLHLEGRIRAEELQAFRSRRLHVLDVQTYDQMLEAPPPVTLSVKRESSTRDPQIIFTATVQGQRDRVRLVALVPPDYLWDADAVKLDGAQLCVRDASQVLSCIGDSPDEAEGPSLTAAWELFLRPTFGVDAWVVETEQSQRAALAGGRAFQRVFPWLACVAVALALLLSVVQIRRSHRPLALLTQAAARIGERRFNEALAIDSDDEFGRVARAFNQMAASIARQFAILGALGRIDRLILAAPQITDVVEKTLPTLPALVQASAAAVILKSENEPESLVYLATLAAPGHVSASRLTLSEAHLRALIDDPQLSVVDQQAATSGCQSWYAAPIRVERRLRGALLLGVAAAELDPEQRRQARAFARRFAVALGAEERRRALLRQAYYDDLTGLPNRQLFKDRLHQKLAHAKRAGEQVALIYIDLDRFKNINDSLGHSAGDQLLRLVSARLSSVMRDVDTLARLGGDEFVVIAASICESPAHLLAERLQGVLASPISVREVSCVIEASMGIAVYPQDGANGEVLLRNADTAMYRAKAAGGGQAVYFEESMNLDAMRRLRVEQRLRHALTNRELRLLYQPKVRTHDGLICGVEALARWTDAELGPVSPAEFIPIAEECGMIEELGEWAMREACAAYGEWCGEGVDVGCVSVNVSIRQLSSADFLGVVRSVLEETRTPACALELEVTESTLAERPQEVIAILEQLRRLGVRIAIDDFGVGYSSMAALGQMPADVLKIDRSFVQDCGAREDADSIVEAIISMAHALGKLTVAEGVETKAQLAVLERLGCDAIQGFLFARPLAAHRVAAFCRSLSSIGVVGASAGEQRASDEVDVASAQG